MNISTFRFQFIFASLALIGSTACSDSTTETIQEVISEETTKTEYNQEDVQQVTPIDKETAIDQSLDLTQKEKYNGNWFSIDYPTVFIASPLEPVETWDGDFEHVSTNEAFFTSPDGQVEFFVYSPQWGGTPKDYLEIKANETITSEKEQTSGDDTWPITDKWVTIEDMKGNYMRAYHSRKTESTHLVFGIRYTSQKAYDDYKSAYLEFKKSLVQFAD